NIQHSNLSNSFLGFICLGRLINLKRVDGVMRAYSNSGVSAGLKFIGDGVLYRELEDMSRSLLNVIMLGKVERNTVLEELQKAKSIVSFSSIEGMPVSILEGISKRCVPIL
ncbi:glycosyltransferase, partial [Vibrio anguillarum]|nr:glycosyltransferase [Vibrio anguillarum]